MEVFFNKTSIGYKHINDGKPCQDYSDCYRDDKCVIITACDGHGGEMYIRSDRGAKFASAAAICVLRRRAICKLPEKYPDELIDKIKLEILCEWNKLVEQDYAAQPFTNDEIAALSPEERFEIEHDYTLAYGTTLHAACITDELCCCVSIGDGGMFYVAEDRQIDSVFKDDDSEPVANMTYSMCSENAFAKMQATFLVMLNGYVSGVILCTDGVTNPYISYENFVNSFAMPVVKKIELNGECAIAELKDFVVELGERKGTGDDVSVALYYRSVANGHKSSDGDAVCE